MSEANRFGLSRHIPDAIKSEIRKKCGFGCVICGSNIYEYDHVDPEFKDAKEHNPQFIALLCNQCHGKVTRHFWSRDKVRQAMLSPYCSSQGFSNEAFDFGLNHPSIVFAGNTLKNCPIPIRVRDRPLFRIDQPEQAGAPFRLSANFYNSQGKESLIIQENEWRALTSNWDVETSGGMITVKESADKVSLQIKCNPPTGLSIEKLDMFILGFHFFGDKEKLFIQSNGGTMELSGNLMDGCQVGMQFG